MSGKALVAVGVGLGLLEYMMPDSKATFNVPEGAFARELKDMLLEKKPTLASSAAQLRNGAQMMVE